GRTAIGQPDSGDHMHDAKRHLRSARWTSKRKFAHASVPRPKLSGPEDLTYPEESRTGHTQRCSTRAMAASITTLPINLRSAISKIENDRTNIIHKPLFTKA